MPLWFWEVAMPEFEWKIGQKIRISTNYGTDFWRMIAIYTAGPKGAP
jgi:hypothetical protein